MNSRTRRNIMLGPMEQYIMLAILRHNNRAYGSDITKELDERIDIQITVGALYTTLNRMHEKKVLGVATSEEGERRKGQKYFSVTDDGLKMLVEAREMIDKMKEGLSF